LGQRPKMLPHKRIRQPSDPHKTDVHYRFLLTAHYSETFRYTRHHIRTDRPWEAPPRRCTYQPTARLPVPPMGSLGSFAARSRIPEGTRREVALGYYVPRRRKSNLSVDGNTW